ncbi:hypothetical protein HNQ85_002029 [Anoxybacillus calidus]|uniref:DUF2953 domain-containing protein n=1 Tax=[Anoxybacillus] calidus TaxID=575178 RepID=A0A7V9Z0A7_9BACL|nr:DUF2953 domain-containing protein [Anoxybacillus calidus]MBA2871754.1 hypothetical protein [Anoxybacillus calidus]
MNAVLFIAVGLICFIMFISMMRMSILIDVKHAQGDDRVKITLKTLFGLIRYTINIPLVKVDKESLGIIVSRRDEMSYGKSNVEIQPKKNKYTPSEIVDSLKQTKRFVNHVVHLHSILKKFLSHIAVTKFEWHTTFGTGDAAYTGMAIGIGWSVKYGIVAIVSRYMKLKTGPVITITPSFQQAMSQTHFICMIHFRIGHAMLAGMRIVKYWRGNSLSKLKSFVAGKANESY